MIEVRDAGTGGLGSEGGTERGSEAASKSTMDSGQELLQREEQTAHKGGKKARAWRPSEAAIGVLRLADRKMGLYTYCSNRSEYGARMGTIAALRRRGLIDAKEPVLTNAGREILQQHEKKR